MCYPCQLVVISTRINARYRSTHYQYFDKRVTSEMFVLFRCLLYSILSMILLFIDCSIEKLLVSLSTRVWNFDLFSPRYSRWFLGIFLFNPRQNGIPKRYVFQLIYCANQSWYTRYSGEYARTKLLDKRKTLRGTWTMHMGCDVTMSRWKRRRLKIMVTSVSAAVTTSCYRSGQREFIPTWSVLE